MTALSKTQGLAIGIGGVLVLVTVKTWLGLPKKVKWVNASGPYVLYLLLSRTIKHELMDLFHEWYEQLGMTFAFKALDTVFVSTIDPKNLEYILKTNFNNYIKGPLFGEPFTDLLGHGIFNVDGASWHSQRKIASHMFTKKAFETHIWGAVSLNCSKVEKILDESNGATLDFFNLMNRFTLDTIGQTAFSRDVGSLDNPSSPFLRSFDRAQRILLRRIVLKSLPIWRLERFLNIGVERRLKMDIDILDDYSRKIVRDLKAKVDTTEDSSFVGLFIKDQWTADKDPAQQETFMRDMVLNFLIAGRDTTAQCLSWTMFELTQHPEVAEKARAEITSVCGDQPVRHEHMKSLTYVKAILDEGLRLHPSVPMDGKVAVARDTLPDGTVVPAGCTVAFHPYAQGRCQKLWGEDACTYRPERWIEMPNRPSSFTFSAFNAGPRECLGKRLAEMEMVTLLTMLLRGFDFCLDAPASTIRPDVQLTLGMCGMPLSVKRRA